MDQLKDVILSTLAEIQEEEIQPQKQIQPKETATLKEPVIRTAQSETKKVPPTKENFFEEVTAQVQTSGSESELLFLQSLRERLLVLFEGFQALNNTALEAKIDLTLNFLEYVLSSIDTRIEHVKGK
jgi:hypothetical protein